MFAAKNTYKRTFDCDTLSNMKLSDVLITPCVHMVTALVLALLYVRRLEYVRTFDCDAISNMKLSDVLITPCVHMVTALVLALLYVRP